MLSEHEKSQLRSLLSDPRWGVLVKISETFIAHIKDTDPARDTEWETVRACLAQSGKIEGIRSFLNELIKQAT